jgi:biopolymer transport protein ExbD
MRRRHRRQEEDAAIDMTPMLDIVFIMLIFFIVTATFVKESGIDVTRPANVERLHAENPQGGAVIQADKDAQTGTLIEVMDQVRLAGVGSIAIAAEEK